MRAPGISAAIYQEGAWGHGLLMIHPTGISTGSCSPQVRRENSVCRSGRVGKVGN